MSDRELSSEEKWDHHRAGILEAIQRYSEATSRAEAIWEQHWAGQQADEPLPPEWQEADDEKCEAASVLAQAMQYAGTGVVRYRGLIYLVVSHDWKGRQGPSIITLDPEKAPDPSRPDLPEFWIEMDELNRKREGGGK